MLFCLFLTSDCQVGFYFIVYFLYAFFNYVEKCMIITIYAGDFQYFLIPLALILNVKVSKQHLCANILSGRSLLMATSVRHSCNLINTDYFPELIIRQLEIGDNL